VSIGPGAILARLKVRQGERWRIDGHSTGPLTATLREDPRIVITAASPAELETLLMADESNQRYGGRATRWGTPSGASDR
jgi:hypothetical protein